MGGEETLHEMIVFGIGVVNLVTLGALFVMTSFASSGSQKKEYSVSSFRCGDDEDAETFNREVISFVSSASGSQKKVRSEMGFVQGVTGEEMTFLGGAIQRDTTCCIGVSCDGTDVEMILLAGNGLSEMTCWTGGDRILHSLTLYGPFAFRGITFCMGSEAIVHSTIGNDGKTCNDETA